ATTVEAAAAEPSSMEATAAEATTEATARLRRVRRGKPDRCSRERGQNRPTQHHAHSSLSTATESQTLIQLLRSCTTHGLTSARGHQQPRQMPFSFRSVSLFSSSTTASTDLFEPLMSDPCAAPRPMPVVPDDWAVPRLLVPGGGVRPVPVVAVPAVAEPA